MQLPPWVVFLAGLVIVVVGAELLLRAATRLALLLKVPPLLVGLTIVAVGTSMPELAVGLAAVDAGRGSLAVGNIAGANILNLLFILGLSAAIRPLPLRLLSIRLDVPVMVAAAVLLLALAADGVLTRGEGALLVAAAMPYTVALVVLSRRESALARREFAEAYPAAAVLAAPAGRPPPAAGAVAAWNALLLLAGMALTLLGAELLVAGAVALAAAFGVGDAVVGLTIVALGTCAPELATTLVATFKDDRDVAIGNLIGSGIYNVLVILGLTCLAAPEGVALEAGILRIDLPLAALVACACYPVFRSGGQVSRAEGMAFVAAYFAYLGLLLLRA